MTQEIDMYEEFDARVEKFLRKQMTEAEEQQFKDELAADPDKKSRARAMALMASQMRDIRRQQETAAVQQMSSMSETEFRKKFVNHTSYIKNHKYRWFSIAACMIGVLTIGGIQYNAYNRTTALGDTYYNLVSSDISSQRGDIDDQSVANLQKLFGMVAKGENLDATIASLRKLYEATSNYAQPNYELGITNYALCRQTIAWNLALAHLKDGNRDAAKEILTTIIAENDPDKAISKSANKLISEIADIPSLW